MANVLLCCFMFAVAVKGQLMVNCFAEPSCLGNQNLGTEDNCCNHGVAPFGVSFAIPGIEGCFPCPVGKFPGDDYSSR